MKKKKKKKCKKHIGNHEEKSASIISNGVSSTKNMLYVFHREAYNAIM